MSRILSISAILLATLLAAACSGAPEERAPAKTTDVVQWPQVRALDDVTHRLKAAAESGTREEILALATEWAEAVRAVAGEKMPADVANPEQVRVHLDEVRSLARLITTAEVMPDESLRKLVAGFSSPVHNLTDAAGLPHLLED